MRRVSGKIAATGRPHIPVNVRIDADDVATLAGEALRLSEGLRRVKVSNLIRAAVRRLTDEIRGRTSSTPARQ